MLCQKGVYPYSYFDNFEKFNETTLPHKQAFYNILTEEPITDSEYAHAVNVFKQFNMESLLDYHNLYLLTDILLLADAFCAFRDMCYSSYGLDPCRFCTIPGLAWTACLKMCKSDDIELITDPEQHLFFEEGIRGGVVVSTRRYAHANVPEQENYDPTKENEFIIYLDGKNKLQCLFINTI